MTILYSYKTWAKSEEMLAQIGISKTSEFWVLDPYMVYLRLQSKGIQIGLNGLYVFISAHENISWLGGKRVRKKFSCAWMTWVWLPNNFLFRFSF